VRRAGEKLLIFSLLALYGGVALLGYGLHELSPAHQHAHANSTPHEHSHAGCSHHHHQSPAPIPDLPGWSDSHDCDICQLLDQMRGELPQIASVEVWRPLATDLSAVDVLSPTTEMCGFAAPRGPPAVIS
jgi:hypothetical protein